MEMVVVAAAAAAVVVKVVVAGVLPDLVNLKRVLLPFAGKVKLFIKNC